jgi:hypothetical protein
MGRSSVASTTSSQNIGEEYRTSERMVNVVFVYVLNCHGQPLIPCQPRKARLLLKQGKAKVVKMAPFTIQLHYGSSGYKQAVSLGVDAGTHRIGVCAATEQHILFEAEVQPRTDIQALLATRLQYRRARRSRKTRYRKARFLNRKKPAGWLAPSVRHKVTCHLKTIALIHKILPIRRTTIEVAQFDLQQMKHPEIAGVEYQQGPQLGFWNVREYVLFRDNHTCQWCGGTSKDPILNVHHIESRKTGGDRPDNLITLCERCHRLIHSRHQEHNIPRPSGRFRDATHMGIMRRYMDSACSIVSDIKIGWVSCSAEGVLVTLICAHWTGQRSVPAPVTRSSALSRGLQLA